MSRVIRLGLLSWVAIAASGCSEPPPTISNTGYVGTWTRGSERVTSEIAIVQAGEGYLFRWNIDSSDDSWKVRCNWEGSCEEWLDGQRSSEYQFRTWVDDESQRLIVECRGKVYGPPEQEVHYVDELFLRPDGLQLRSRMLRQGERVYDTDKPRPGRRFEKVSDSVADPPSRAG